MILRLGLPYPPSYNTVLNHLPFPRAAEDRPSTYRTCSEPVRKPWHSHLEWTFRDKRFLSTTKNFCTVACYVAAYGEWGRQWWGCSPMPVGTWKTAACMSPSRHAQVVLCWSRACPCCRETSMGGSHGIRGLHGNMAPETKYTSHFMDSCLNLKIFLSTQFWKTYINYFSNQKS